MPPRPTQDEVVQGLQDALDGLIEQVPLLQALSPPASEVSDNREAWMNYHDEAMDVVTALASFMENQVCPSIEAAKKMLDTPQHRGKDPTGLVRELLTWLSTFAGRLFEFADMYQDILTRREYPYIQPGYKSRVRAEPSQPTDIENALANRDEHTRIRIPDGTVRLAMRIWTRASCMPSQLHNVRLFMRSRIDVKFTQENLRAIRGG